MRELEWTEEQMERYSRQVLLDDIGLSGQEKIYNAKVLVIGLGGLGSPVALYLAAAGVGKMGLVDGDSVDLSNLQRQIIHSMIDIGIPKVESARNKILAVNPEVEVETYQTFLNATNILEIVSGYDVIVDGTDNFATKFLINDACVLANKPFSHGGILRFGGQTMSIKPKESACYACIFDRPPPQNTIPTCASAGILGAVAGMLGSIQAAEVLKIITGIGEPLYGRFLSYDAKTMKFRNIKIKRNVRCRVCGLKGITTLSDYEQLNCFL
ncbi:adenylyltransferase [Helicobacter monodelphidis]|uniref:HesA/MoeB/ThiF family protein n=1 Tax=Helicobacter sp. 15-1451 TaxID=2004995 RepID=UPI000DCBC006|nr:HesA/MoeB/ThiF family protein [Helicobacter sp. 15-1451]RAX58951.1 adenylyltransferase [Helicobacter sp. 15-1451]